MEQSAGIQASLSGRYATALFEQAQAEGQLASVADGLARLRQALAASPELRQLVASPVVSRDQAAGAIAAVARSLELDPLASRFLAVLAANRRLGQLSAIIRDFNRLAARARGEVSAEVVSAHPLDDGQMAALKARLKSMTGSEVAVEATVDPALLGGLVVRLGSRQIDGSIRTRLRALAGAMKG